MHSDASLSLDRASITVLVHRFYDAIRADAELGPVFEAELHGRWDAHLQRMVDFWCTAMKVSRSFRGNVYGREVTRLVAGQHIVRREVVQSGAHRSNPNKKGRQRRSDVRWKLLFL